MTFPIELWRTFDSPVRNLRTAGFDNLKLERKVPSRRKTCFAQRFSYIRHRYHAAGKIFGH